MYGDRAALQRSIDSSNHHDASLATKLPDEQVAGFDSAGKQLNRGQAHVQNSIDPVCLLVLAPHGEAVERPAPGPATAPSGMPARTTHVPGRADLARVEPGRGAASPLTATHLICAHHCLSPRIATLPVEKETIMHRLPPHAAVSASGIEALRPMGLSFRPWYMALFLIVSGPLMARADEPRSTPDTAGHLDLPDIQITVKGDPATTEDTHSYTTAQTAAATRLPLSLRETPQSVSVITRQQMDDQQLNSVKDVLQHTTGVSSSTLDSERTSFYARGFSIDSFQFDGIPTTFVPGASFLDTAFYDRIEVVRGATGLLTGAGNPSASVNLVRKRPTAELSANASISAGSWDTYRGTADLSTPLTADGRVRARIIGVEQDRHSYIDFYHQKKQAFYGVLEADLSPDTLVSLGYDYQDITPRGTTWGGMPLFYSDGSRTHYSRSKSLAAQWSRWDNTLKTTFANLEHHFDNDWKLRLAFNQGETESETRLLSALGYPNRVTGEGLIPVAMASKGNTRQNSYDLMASGPFQLLGREHEMVFGWMDSRRKTHDLDSGFMFPGTPMLRPDGRYPKPDFAAAQYSRSSTLTEQDGSYAALRLSLADPLTLIIGGRLSNYEVSQRNAGQSFHYKKTGEFTPYVGLVYDFNDTYSAYASYTEIFNPQTNRDQNGRILAPMEGKNREVGVKAQYLDGRLNASVAVFDIRQDNVAQTDIGHLLPDGTQAYYAVNGTKSQGFDIDVSGELSDGWNLLFGYSHYTATTGTGASLSTSLPRTTTQLFTTYRLPDALDKLTIGGGATWQSRFYQDAIGPQGTVQVEQKAYALASLMMRYDLSGQTSVAVNANNLFDKKYYSMIGFYNQGLYGDPRNITLSLSYKL